MSTKIYCKSCKKEVMPVERGTTNVTRSYWKLRGYHDFYCYWSQKQNSPHLNLTQKEKILPMVMGCGRFGYLTFEKKDVILELLK